MNIDEIVAVMDGPNLDRRAAFLALARYLVAHPTVQIAAAVNEIAGMSYGDGGPQDATDDEFAKVVK